mgnify:CR=1 FL=1
MRGCWQPARQDGVKVRRISVDDPALEVFVHSPDRDGLFAAIVMTLDRKGYGIHRARVLDKVGVRNTAELVRYALRKGLLD